MELARGGAVCVYLVNNSEYLRRGSARSLCLTGLDGWWSYLVPWWHRWLSCQGQCQDPCLEDGLRLMAAAISGMCAVVHTEGLSG
jgi:hypothetical protein